MPNISRRAMALAAPLLLALIPATAHAQASFVDQLGRTITLDAPPAKLIALPSASPLIYYAIDGTTDHIAGAAAAAINTFKGGLYDETIPELMQLDTTMAGPDFATNVEAVLAAQPDLLLEVTHIEGRIEQLESVGLKVAAWNCCTEEQRRGYLTMSAAIAGKPERAVSLLKLQDDSNAALLEHFKSVDPASYTRVLLVDKIGEQIQVVANDSQTYSLSGATNLAADGTGEWWRTIDAEQLLVWNPEVIIIPAWEAELTPEAFYNDPLLGSVDAVKNRRVYKTPKFNRSPDAAEVHLTAQWLARITHPADFAGQTPFRDTLKATFSEIYGKDLTEELVDKILEVEANTVSTDYAELLG